MCKIFIVILHYQNIDDTLNCTESIDNLVISKNIEINIVIIDNASPNGSGIVLKKKFKSNKNYNVIILDENYGFSKANNIGYRYSKQNGADLVIVSNNDVLFEDKFFINKLVDYYIKNKECEIICPDVINLDGMHQNPIGLEPQSSTTVLKNMIYKRFISILLLIPVLRKIVLNFELNREKKWLNNYYNENCKYEIDRNYFVPIGAFIIYTKKWILQEDLAFPCPTFMYVEEDFLTQYIIKHNYSMKYSTDLKIKHLVGRSINNNLSNKYKSVSYKYKVQSHALKQYYIYINNKKEGGK